MTRRVRRASSIAQGIRLRSSPSRQIEAESRDRSVPQPSAMPTSLAERRGASLIPSPIIATGPSVRVGPLDRVDLLRRHQLGLDGHVELPGDDLAAGRVIACEHADIQRRPGQPLNHIESGRPPYFIKNKEATRQAVPADQADRPALATRHSASADESTGPTRHPFSINSRLLPSTIGEAEVGGVPMTPRPATTRMSHESRPGASAGPGRTRRCRGTWHATKPPPDSRQLETAVSSSSGCSTTHSATAADSGRQRSRLVEPNRGDFGQAFEGLAAPEQDPLARRVTERTPHRQWRGQPQTATDRR